MKKILILVMLVSFLNVWAGEKTGQSNLGFVTGELCRNGIGYRYWKDDSWGYQLSGMLMATKDKTPDDYYDYSNGYYYAWGREVRVNFGASLMKTLSKHGQNRFYTFAGYGIKHHERKSVKSNISSMSNPEFDRYQITNNHYMGIGVGIDIELLEYLRFFLEIPLTFQSNGEITMYLPQFGVFYRF